MSESEAFKLINAIEELTLMLSERLWSDDQIKDRFALASLADGARSSALGLRLFIENGGFDSKNTEDKAETESTQDRSNS